VTRDILAALLLFSWCSGAANGGKAHPLGLENGTTRGVRPRGYVRGQIARGEQAWRKEL